MKVALYTRVSTSHQEFSIDTQKEILNKYCENNNYEIYKLYTDDGISGKDTKHRPAFNEMIEDMKIKRFSKIIITKLDRLSRSVIDLENTVQLMQRYKCDLESTSEKIDTSSAMGMMFLRLLGIFAQFERERISERITDVFREKVRKGGATTGRLPVGYMIGVDSSNNKIVIKNKEEEEFVTTLFNSYLKTNSLRKTCDILNSQFKLNRYPNGIDRCSLKSIMKRTLYYGSHLDNDNYCDPYITKDEWDKINNLRESKNIKTKRKNSYIFSHLLKDKYGHWLCGATRSSNKHSAYYGCGVNSNSKTRCPESRLISEYIIEEDLLKIIPSEIDKKLKDYKIAQKKEKDFSQKINSLQSERERIINSYTKGWITEEKAETEIKSIDIKIKELETKPKHVNLDNLNTVLSDKWIDIYKMLDKERKCLMWREIIDYIVIDFDKYKEKKDYMDIHFFIN